MKLWLDDLRPAPDGWTWVTTAPAAIERLGAGGVLEVSLDHDLGEDPAAGSGYDVAMFIEEAAFHGRLGRVAWAIHSANPVGRQRMTRALENAERWWDRAS
jgi:hypothetical protein